MAGVEILDAAPVPVSPGQAFVVLVRLNYADSEPETYVVALAPATGASAARWRRSEPDRVVSATRSRAGVGVLYDASDDGALAGALLEAIARRRVFEGSRGELVGVPGRAFRRVRGRGPLEAAPLGAEQSHTTFVFGDRLILKVFRRVEPGPNPEVEIGRFLTERARFAHVPALAGALEYRPRKGEPTTLGVVQAFVPNQGDAWTCTLDALERYYERLLAMPTSREVPPQAPASLVARAKLPIPPDVDELMGTAAGDARLLGRRTAELHLALASGTGDPAFAPEPFTPVYRRSLQRSMRSLTVRSLGLLRQRLPVLPEDVRQAASTLVRRQCDILDRFSVIARGGSTAMRIRVHGDFHLGQVLRANRDFVIMDFEGEPAAPLRTRRLKHCPLRDAAGMVRSFHYAAHRALHDLEARKGLSCTARKGLEPWTNAWYVWVAAAFLDGYLAGAGDAPFLPKQDRARDALLTAFLLEKALYELEYELNHRPEWVRLPLAGLDQLLQAGR